MNQDTQARHDAAVLSDVKEWHARHGRRLQHDTLTAPEIARWEWNKARDEWVSAVVDWKVEIAPNTDDVVRAERSMNAAQAAWVAAVDAEIEG